jgi:dihydrodipicolinate synthase/N-acetylneuraminate lyase
VTSAPQIQSGIIPILNTPFDAQGRIDVDSLERALEQHIADGITGCIVPAVASEVQKLNNAERAQLIETSVAVAAGRIPVIGGASSETADDVVRLARHAQNAGCSAVLVQVPQQLYADSKAIRRFVGTIVEHGEIERLILQDLEWNGPGMAVDQIATLHHEVPALVGIKIETVPAGTKYSQVIEVTEGTLPVLGGWGLPQMIEGLDRGVYAFTPTAMNKPFVHIDRLYRMRRRDEAVELFERVVPALAFSCQHIDISIHFLKRYSVQRGWFSTATVRDPILTYDKHHERYGDEVTGRLIDLEDGLPDLSATAPPHTVSAEQGEP